MKSILTQLALLLMSMHGFSQSTQGYADLYLEPSGILEVKRGGFERYDLGGLYFYNGLGSDAKSLYVEDVATGARIFEFDDKKNKASRFKPKFFKSSDDQPLVVMVSLETSYSWGQHIFIIDNNQVNHSGFIAYGADDFNFSNLALYARFEHVQDYFNLTFPAEESFIDYSTDDLIAGDKLKFRVEKNKIIKENL